MCPWCNPWGLAILATAGPHCTAEYLVITEHLWAFQHFFNYHNATQEEQLSMCTQSCWCNWALFPLSSGCPAQLYPSYACIFSWPPVFMASCSRVQVPHVLCGIITQAKLYPFPWLMTSRNMHCHCLSCSPWWIPHIGGPVELIPLLCYLLPQNLFGADPLCGTGVSPVFVCFIRHYN